MNIAKKGFTLIELLVVITIIGILATGAVSVYTSQIQKARDTTRLNDVKALQSGAEQFYQDESEYPDAADFLTAGAWVLQYVPQLPKDWKDGQTCNNGWGNTATICSYTYAVWDDANGISAWSYEFSTAFENSGNVSKKANDTTGNNWWNDDLRFEVGLLLDVRNSDITATNTTVAWGTDTDFVISGSDIFDRTGTANPQ